MPTSRLSWLHPLMHWFPFFKESIVFTVKGKYVFPCVFSGKCLLGIWKQVLSLVLISLYLVSYIQYMYVHMHMQIYMYCLVMHACTCGIHVHVHVIAAYHTHISLLQYCTVQYGMVKYYPQYMYIHSVVYIGTVLLLRKSCPLHACIHTLYVPFPRSGTERLVVNIAERLLSFSR